MVSGISPETGKLEMQTETILNTRTVESGARDDLKPGQTGPILVAVVVNAHFLFYKVRRRSGSAQLVKNIAGWFSSAQLSLSYFFSSIITKPQL